MGFKEDAHATPMGRCRMAMGAGAWTVVGGVKRDTADLAHLAYFFLEKRVERILIFFFHSALKKKKNLRPPETLDKKNSAQTLQTMQHPCGSVWCTPEHAEHPFHSQDASACGWGMKGHEVHSLPTDDATAERVRVPPRVRSGHLPREDHASNLMGPVREITGLLEWRRLFRAVRRIGRK